jgi:hypothetical protein
MLPLPRPAAIPCALLTGPAVAAPFTLDQTLGFSVADDFDQFGYSVGVSGGTAIIGARFDDTGAFNAGAAHLYDTTTGDLVQTLLNPTPRVARRSA